MQEKQENRVLAQDELSDTWRELLGNSSAGAHSGITSGEATLPTLESDPWSTLLQAKGIEEVDLQQLHLPVSDQELERLLQIMQEQPAQKLSADADSTSNHH
jgi:hypothetical protein